MQNLGHLILAPADKQRGGGDCNRGIAAWNAGLIRYAKSPFNWSGNLHRLGLDLSPQKAKGLDEDPKFIYFMYGTPLVSCKRE